ncbi:hypothetical protein J4209_03245 [Candidatus Woesearchaeota archaeon]|nr:hypothetical protein [Candidatus Woesearchaeota archaeon]
MYKNLGQRIEEVILVLVILLQFFDFFNMLSAEFDYIEKIVSWSAMGYVLYKVSFSSIFFGNKHKRLDFVIILAYFLLIVKIFVAYSFIIVSRGSLLYDFFNFVKRNAALVEYYSFYLGGLILIFISLYVALRLEIKKPSLMHVIHEEGKPARSIGSFIIRSLTIFFVLIAFFTIVFNLMTEWLAIAIDAPLLMIGVFFYLFVIIRHYQRFKTESLIYKLGNLGDDFYNHFVRLFHYKKTLFLAIIGMLALHLLTDIGNFLISYIFGFKNLLYFKTLGFEAGHLPVTALFIKDSSSVPVIVNIALLFVYIFNIIAMLFLLLMPAFVWYRLSKQKEVYVNSTILGLIFASLVSFLLMPVFSVKKITLESLVGVDIQTRSLLAVHGFIDNIIANHYLAIVLVAILSLIAGVLAFSLSYDKKAKKDLFLTAATLGIIFFSYYIYHFFMSIYNYYIRNVTLLFGEGEYFLSLFFVLFAMSAIIFYIGGFLLFVYEIFRNTSYYKRWLRR